MNNSVNSNSVLPPVAPQRPLTRTFHGDTFIDNYDWLRNKDDAEVIELLNAENAYADQTCAHLGNLTETLVQEIKERTQETDVSAPVLDGGFWYFRRTQEGENYPLICRVADTGTRPQPEPGTSLPGEELLLDCPKLSAGTDFFALGDVLPSPDHSHLAYSVDVSGGELFDLKIKDLSTGEIIDDALTGIAYGIAFSTDGTQIVYCRNDDAWRQYQVWVHTIGSDTASDELLLEEADEKFGVYPEVSRCGRWLLAGAFSPTTTEYYLLDLHNPRGGLRSIAPRRDGIQYFAEVAGDCLLITHNANNERFDIAVAPLGSTSADDWRELLRGAEGERLNWAHGFNEAAVISLRAGGLATLRVLPRNKSVDAALLPHDATPEDVRAVWDTENVWGVPTGGELDTLEFDNNPRFDATATRFTMTSLLKPVTVCEVDFKTREVTELKRQAVPNYDPELYVERREWVEASDGTLVPLSVAHRKEITPDGTNPGYLYGYGSYEACIDPYFSVSRLSLLDRGVVFAIAHVRGGGEMGRAWYEDGKLLNKKNTFTDFVAAAHFLQNSGWVAKDRLAAEGRSAGGLLMGAITNLAPETFRVVLAGVPFVDALTTILNPDLPLTVGEWEEWGNPLDSAEVYQYMKEYTPYENIAAYEYPALLATTSLNDVRVSYTEPFKWVQQLRATVTNDPATRPILLRTEMVAGHGGRSGRYNQWFQRSEEAAFVLDQIGATERM